MDARTMANYVIELLQLSYLEGLSDDQAAALELAAAIMANHVKDWHFGGPATKDQFAQWKQEFPDWEMLNQIANGTKHVVEDGFSPSQASLSEVTFEQYDFWHTAGLEKALRVEVNGVDRPLRALTVPFAERYLERYPPESK